MRSGAPSKDASALRPVNIDNVLGDDCRAERKDWELKTDIGKVVALDVLAWARRRRSETDGDAPNSHMPAPERKAPSFLHTLFTVAVRNEDVQVQRDRIGGELHAAIALSVLACQLACLLCSCLREAVSGLGSSATVLGQAEVVEHQRGEDRLVVKGLGVLIEEMCPEIGAHAMIEQERLCAAQGGSSAIMRCVITGVP
jgi:hypothetical protein